MKEITFRAKLNEEASIPSLLKEIHKIPCRLEVDFEYNLVMVENIEDSEFEAICNLVHDFFTVTSFDVDNTEDSVEDTLYDEIFYEDTDIEFQDILVSNTENSKIPKEAVSSNTVDSLSTYENSNYFDFQKMCKKFEAEEKSLSEIIGFALDKLEPSIPAKNQIESFLSDIGMPVLDFIVKSFEIACTIDKLNYPNLLYELKLMHPSIDYDYIESMVKKTFAKWVREHVTLAEKHPTISFISLLKVFSDVFS